MIKKVKILFKNFFIFSVCYSRRKWKLIFVEIK